MPKMNSKIISVALFLILLLGAVFYLLIDEKHFETETSVPTSKTKSLPVPNIEEYVESFNKGLNQSEKKRKEREENKTSADIAKEKAFVEKVLSIAKRSLQDILFYGKVVDQHGAPVRGARVTFVAQGETFASGSGTQYTKTDDNGIFIAKDIHGAAFVVEKFEKEGYQSPPRERFLNNYGHARKGQYWVDYSAENNPFVFKAWKVGDKGYPNVADANGGYGFRPNTVYSLDFTADHKARVKKKGKLGLDLQVLFEKDSAENWTLSLKVPDGGLVEADGLYMNIAPESGYQQELQFSGTQQDYEKNRNSIQQMRSYYIHSRGKYGRLEMEIRPYSKPKGSGIRIKHVLNLDGGRNLEVK